MTLGCAFEALGLEREIIDVGFAAICEKGNDSIDYEKFVQWVFGPAASGSGGAGADAHGQEEELPEAPHEEMVPTTKLAQAIQGKDVGDLSKKQNEAAEETEREVGAVEKDPDLLSVSSRAVVSCDPAPRKVGITTEGLHSDSGDGDTWEERLVARQAAEPKELAAALRKLARRGDALGLQNFSGMPLDWVFLSGASCGDSRHRTPAHLAAMHGHVAVLVTLGDLGAPLNLQDKPYRQTPAHLAAIHEHPAALCTLVELGAALDVKDDLGFTPAHYAARFGRAGALQALTDLGVPMDVRDDFNSTPADLASRWRNPHGSRGASRRRT